MPAVGALFALLFVATIAGTIGLWYAIDRETDDPPRMDRAEAERAARQDADESEDRSSDEGNDWGTETEWGVDDRQ
ncbi:hypothetical protein [Halolamina sediminis]|jgi:hypothetical protein|uniref:hypothetical protein n=1 Tax=Halolamina sediminis TaxID=1480675 RepID=UPI0006B54B5C|nr:hypothetical protein [Halolamina sediminis]